MAKNDLNVLLNASHDSTLHTENHCLPFDNVDASMQLADGMVWPQALPQSTLWNPENERRVLRQEVGRLCSGLRLRLAGLSYAVDLGQSRRVAPATWLSIQSKVAKLPLFMFHQG
jgi:hypothetical protein